METKTIKIEDKALDHIKRLDAAIRQHSSQHTQAMLQAQRLLSLVAAVEEAKAKYISERLKEQGVDVDRVEQAMIQPDGNILLQLSDPSGEQTPIQ